MRVFLSQDMVNYTDVIGIHPYVVYRTPPYNGYWAYLSQIKYASSLVKQSRGFSNKPLFITEIGWSTASSNKGVSENHKANLLLMLFVMQRKLVFLPSLFIRYGMGYQIIHILQNRGLVFISIIGMKNQL